MLRIWKAGCSLLLAAVVVAGCAGASVMNRIRIGMTEKEVVARLGDPDTSAADSSTRFFNYWLKEPGGFKTWYFVRFYDARVISYGRLGDFDSTEDPTTKVKVEWKDVK